MSTVRSARDRLMALCELIALPSPLGASHAYETEEECSFSSDDLPAFVIHHAPDQTYSRLADASYATQFEFLILLYVSPIQDESYRKNVDAWDVVYDCMEVVNDFFAARPTLAMNDGGVVDQAQMSRGRKIPLATKGSDTKYHGASFRLVAASARRIEQYDGVDP